MGVSTRLDAKDVRAGLDIEGAVKPLAVRAALRLLRSSILKYVTFNYTALI